MTALVPKTSLGKLSLWFIIAMPILFVAGGLLSNALYLSVPAGNTITEDLATRPLLALSMLTGMLCGISAFVTGLVAILKEKENALLVILSTAFGALLLIFLLGEVLFPH